MGLTWMDMVGSLTIYILDYCLATSVQGEHYNVEIDMVSLVG